MKSGTPLLVLTACTLSLCMSACKAPMHLSYDFGRAYTSTFSVQSDLTRSSVMSAQYPLGGAEGVEIRMLVTEESTDSEDATVSLSAAGGG